MYCSISGKVPEEPVISRKSGHLFEKRLVEKYIEANGTCPVTGDTLSVDDLLPVQGNKAVQPRPPAATSVPGLLALFQNEWDSLMLETYTLRQHLETVRQELSHTLYQHDAACRVIARLIKERDAARSALSQASTSATGAGVRSNSSMEVDQQAASTPSGLTDQDIAVFVETSSRLSSGRKSRKVSSTLVSADELSGFGVQSSNPIHSTSQPGILAVDVNARNSSLIATGGVDHKAVVFDQTANQVVATMSGHSKAVTRVLFHTTEDVLFTSSADKTARIWGGDGSCASVTRVHEAEVTGVALHASGQYFATTSLDATWGLHSVATGQCLSVVGGSAAGYTSLGFHPDGLILGTGTADNKICIWDLKSRKNAKTFDSHQGKVTSVNFSENGYYMVSASEDATVRCWDLRKLQQIYCIDLDAPVNDAKFDFSGQYLATAGSTLNVYKSKSWDLIRSFDEHTAPVTGVAWGPDAKFLASSSMDRTLKIWCA
mgnify:CR=1 FL=1